ncbi:MAG: hypothetical protein J6S17_00430, partial [Aeriscardovia sp.]|nr:hypothetical protein [Aeriscardovia sp.]
MAVEDAGGIEAAKEAGSKEWVRRLMESVPSALYPTVPALASIPLPPASDGTVFSTSLIAKILELAIMEKEVFYKKELTEGRGSVEEILSRIQNLEEKKQDLRRIMAGKNEER